MASRVLLLLSIFALRPAQILVAGDQLSQIDDGQVQAAASVTALPPDTQISLEETSTISETITASALPVLNMTAVVAAMSSTTGSTLPTSILMAAPVGAAGAASNYTGLQTVAGGPFPTPNVPIPVNGTTAPTLGPFNATKTGSPGDTATSAPTNSNEGGSAASTSSEEPIPATGAGERLKGFGLAKGLVAVCALVLATGVI